MMNHSYAIESVAQDQDACSAIGQNDADFVPSPCISVCQMDEVSGLCKGCFRRLDEIGQWGNADAAYRRSVLSQIKARIAAKSA